jgi:hypothetical protein
LRVFVAALAFEARDFVAFACYRLPFVAGAVGALFVDFPERFGVVDGYWHAAFG